MIRWAVILIGVLILPGQLSAQDEVLADATNGTRQLVIVIGAEGSPEYGGLFHQWGEQWMSAGRRAGFVVSKIDGSSSLMPPYEELKHRILNVAAGDHPTSEFWLILIGHGTFNGEHAKFNLVGKDVTATEIGEWFKSGTCPTVVVNCASSSAPFTNALTGPNRIVVTSTSSGYEMSFSYFGGHLADAISTAGIDLDKDSRTSLLEAVVVAAGKTREFYEEESRLASEHALIEDNGDGRGTPVEWFRGVRVSRKARDGATPDGLRANQIFFAPAPDETELAPELLIRRNELEDRIEELRGQKQKYTEDEYYGKLAKLMTGLSKIYATLPRDESSSGN